MGLIYVDVGIRLYYINKQNLKKNINNLLVLVISISICFHFWETCCKNNVVEFTSRAREF